MPRLQTLICGGGVGGNALAFWLSKLGHDVTVVERFPSLRVTGLQIDLRGHGIEVMKRMGLEAAVRAKCTAEPGIELVDTHGKQWAYFPANKSGKGAQTFTSEFEIMRGDLCQLLYDGTRQDRVKYVFGASVAGFTNTEGGSVQVDLTNGDSGVYDLLVGADGLFSSTRKLMVGAGDDDGFRSLDDYIGYSRVPCKMQEGEDFTATMYVAKGSRGILTRRSNEEELQVYLVGSKLGEHLKKVKRGDAAAEKQAFADAFCGIGWKTDHLLKLMMESDDFYCQTEGFVKLASWSRGHTTLLGDAGYAMSVNGYGTSSALMGAYILAGELARHVGPADAKLDSKARDEGIRIALEAYQRKLQPYVDLQQRGLGEPSWFDDLELKEWQLVLLYWAAWLASLLRVDKLAWFWTDRDKAAWKLPDYPELKA